MSDSGQPAKRRRNRIPISCRACQVRKLRCNRQRPCQNCETRGDYDDCVYAVRGDDRASRGSAAPVTSGMQERISRLENLVLDALNGSRNEPQEPSHQQASEERVVAGNESKPQHGLPDPTIGILETDSAERHLYSGETAWNTVLHEISDIKASCTESTLSRHYEYETSHGERVQSRQNPSADGSHVEGAQWSHQDLLNQLPPKMILDQLLSIFFDIYSPSMPVQYILHQQTFIDQYWKYLGAPTATGAVWLSQVYSMISIALRFWGQGQHVPAEFQADPYEHSDAFYQLAGHCLGLVDINHPVRGTVEAQSIYLHAGPTFNRKDITKTWLTAGDIVRLAMRMGYHRDPSQYSDLSPFEGEMRRRVWNFIYQTDLLFSFQLGLPPAIRNREYDTATEHNLYEEQLHRSMTTRPAPLAPTEPTYISYMVAQNPVFRVFGDIVETLNTLQPQPYAKILELDGRLLAAFAATPQHLKRTLPDSPTDPPRLVLQRIELELFYHKVNCILHRRFLTAHFKDSVFEPSRQACVSSALRLLTCQIALHDNHRWPHAKWWTSSLNSHDFILAATILCLYLSKDCERDAATLNPQIEDLQQALRQSLAIWTDVRDTCVDAEKAFMIFDSLRRQHPEILPHEHRQGVSSDGPSLAAGALTTDTMSTSPSLFPGADSTEFPKAIDWDLWDSYLRDVEPLALPPYQ